MGIGTGGENATDRAEVTHDLPSEIRNLRRGAENHDFFARCLFGNALCVRRLDKDAEEARKQKEDGKHISVHSQSLLGNRRACAEDESSRSGFTLSAIHTHLQMRRIDSLYSSTRLDNCPNGKPAQVRFHLPRCFHGFRQTMAMLRANRFCLMSFASIAAMALLQRRLRVKTASKTPGIPHVRFTNRVLGR